MSNMFTVLNIDNNAIYIVCDQLMPYLEYKPDAEFRILNDPASSEKNRILYEQIFLPFMREKSDHFYTHHNGSPPESWCGEQACLSMIHAINQKAWWLITFFAVEKVIMDHCNISEEKIKAISQDITGFMIDGDVQVNKAVDIVLDKEKKLDKHIKALIVEEIQLILDKYRATPSHHMMYR